MSNARRAIWLLILWTTVIRLIWAGTLELGQDEAYHTLYSVHPDWSYFDHPPMLMYVTKLGVGLCGGWLHPLSVRLGFVLLFAGSTWVMARWTSRWYGDLAGFYAAAALNLAAYYSAAAGAFVLPDGPLLFFALVTMWRLSEALVGTPGRIDAWIWVGLGCAGAMLSKYHAIFLPLGALAYVLLTPSARWNLRRPGPYLAAAIGFLGLLPVIIWNSQHDWVSFRFQGARAVGSWISVTGLATLIFGPMALLFPWIWYSCVEGFCRRLLPVPPAGNARLLLCLSAVPLSLFTLVACTRPILPHWPLIGFLPLFPLVGDLWAQRSLQQPIAVRRWLIFMSTTLLAVAGAFLAQARLGLIQFPFRDPCIEISGWTSVGQELSNRGLLDHPRTFLFTDHWYESGQVAFAVRNRIPTTCYREGDARGFAFWSRPEDWNGWDGVLIDAQQEAHLAESYQPYFESIEELPAITMTRSSRPFRTVRVFLCRNQVRPFPFTYERKSP